MMEKLELEYNDYVSNIFVFTIRDKVEQYYFSCKEDWFLDDWVYQLGNKGKDFVSVMLEKLANDIVDLELLKEEFRRLNQEGKNFVIETHYPMLYIDFDNRVLKSRYYEQALHKRIPNDWIGKYEDFLNEIPIDCRYWQKEEST